MRRITGLKLKDFGGIRSAELDDLPNVVLLVGPTGAGKTSVLQSIEHSLTGEVVTPLARLKLEELRHGSSEQTIVETTWSDGLNIMREIGLKGQQLFVNGSSFKRQAEAEADLYGRLGTDKDTAALLCRTHSFLAMSPLDQFQTLMAFSEGEASTAAELLAGLDEALQVVATEENLVADLDEGHRMIEVSLERAEKARLEVGRDKKTAATAKDEAEAAAQVALQAAGVVPADLDKELAAAQDTVSRETQRLRDAEQANILHEKAATELTVATGAAGAAELAVEQARGRKREAEQSYDEDADKAAQAQVAQREQEHERAQLDVDKYFERLGAISGQLNALPAEDKLEASALCPTCGRQVTAEALEVMVANRARLQGEWAEAKTKHEDAAVTENAKHELHLTAKKDAAGLTAPDLTALSAEVNRLVERADQLEIKREALEEALEKLRTVSEEGVEALAAGVDAAGARLDLVQEAVGSLGKFRETQGAAAGAAKKHGDLNDIVTGWRAWVKERGVDESSDLAEELLSLSPGLSLVLAADGLHSETAAGLDTTRLALHRLSTGERTLAGAAIQTIFATRTGLGVVLVDDASVWDDERAAEWLELASVMAEENDVTLFLATTHWGSQVPSNARVVTVRDGEVIDA